MTLGVLPPALSVRFGKGGTITPLGPDVKITATHAEHSSEIVWKNPETGKDESHIGGEPVGFIIELENGFKIYHMGDTGLFGDMKFIGEYYKPDLIISVWAASAVSALNVSTLEIHLRAQLDEAAHHVTQPLGTHSGPPSTLSRRAQTSAGLAWSRAGVFMFPELCGRGRRII